MSPSATTALAPPRRAALASAVTLAAGLIHAAAAVPHFGDDTLLGTGFMLVGWAQIVVAGLLLRRVASRRTAAAAVAIHLGALVALVVSRTVGLPVGHGGVEPMAFPDAVTAALEVVAVSVLLWWLTRPVVTTRHRVVAGTGLAAVWLLAMTGSTLAVADLGTSGHAHEASAMAGSLADSHSADQSHEGDQATSHTTDPVHIHDDRSIHVHQAAMAHPHADDTVHIHPDERALPDRSGADERSTGQQGGHTHAPGEEHA